MVTDSTCCPFSETCHWHRQPHLYSHRLETEFEDAYCYGEAPRCAIWMVAVALGPGAVPFDMFPGQRARAAEIVARKSGRMADSRS